MKKHARMNYNVLHWVFATGYIDKITLETYNNDNIKND